MKKHYQRSRIVGGGALLALIAVMLLTIVGLSGSVSKISELAISRTPDAILASAGVADKADILLPVSYYDQRADDCVNMYDTGNRKAFLARQFEWTECGYGHKELEKGLVEPKLGTNYFPVFVGGQLDSNRGIVDSARWYESIAGKSSNYLKNIKMVYNSEGAEFKYENGHFYPLDDVEFSKGDITDDKKHNYLFTMSFAIPFMVLKSGEESFEIVADDDTFVFVGDDLVIDMGGIHEAMVGRLTINSEGNVYSEVGNEDVYDTGINLEYGDGELIRVFHADRDSSESVLKIKTQKMNLNVMDTKIASGDGQGVQVAYDPSNPSYVAPLGATSVFEPDTTKGYIIIATIQGILVMVFAMLIIILTKFLIKRNQEA